jgi:hypothetical protein
MAVCRPSCARATPTVFAADLACCFEQRGGMPRVPVIDDATTHVISLAFADGTNRKQKQT